VSDDNETTFGTDPHNPDTDGDGILDGQDPDPLSADLVRTIFLSWIGVLLLTIILVVILAAALWRRRKGGKPDGATKYEAITKERGVSGDQEFEEWGSTSSTKPSGNTIPRPPPPEDTGESAAAVARRRGPRELPKPPPPEA